MREVRLAITLSWIAASLVTISTVIAPYVLSAGQIARITPQCERKAAYGQECFFCGMTTGFIEIAQGRFKEAEASNRGAIPLYGGFVCNGLGLIVALVRGGLGMKQC
ncbi:MAG: DUF2752 domain-containing protein [Bryobacteraceae bacterium]